jgi:2-dehydropantoate 2-reductase
VTDSSVAVVGVGAVGGYFGAQAWRAGHRITLCVRTTFDRLVVESRGEAIEVEAEVVTDPSQVQMHQWVLLATKAHDTKSAAPWLKALCGPDTVVVVMQNGVEHLERVAPLVDNSPILPAIVRYGGEVTAPGRVRHHTYHHLFVPEGELGERLVELFEGSDAEIRLTKDFDKEAWSKLVTNVAANAIPALTMRRFPVFRDERIAALAVGLMRECTDVARARGVELPASLPENEVARLADLPDDVGSSMLYDRLAGRPMEFEALNGAVVRIGQAHQIPTPLNGAVVALLGAISDKAKQ